MQDAPARTREYVSYIFDSRNWDRFRPRPGDIVVSTSYKSGTTWMQNILRHLVYPDDPRPSVAEVSPWLDRRLDDPDAVLAGLQAQTRRRFIKTHLPLDGLPFFPEVRYLVVVRDPRDVFMSFWNHYSGYTEAQVARVNASCVDVAPMPPCPPDLHALWPRWISEGWFPWQSDGWPHSGNLCHTASWWRFRHLPNIRFVHYADLLADLPAEIERIAAFVGLALDRERRDAVARAVSLAALRRDPGAGPLPAERMRAVWRDGPDTFFFKGTNGRWRGVLTPAEVALYEAAKARCVPPDCAAYLEGGRAAVSAPVAR